MSLNNEIKLALRDALHSYEGWLNKDTYVVRREVQAKTTRRTAKPKSYTSFRILKKLEFQGAHAWPLQWGGKEVKDSLLWAHRTVNASRQKRVENAVLRLVERSRGTGIKIFVTVEVEKYPQLKLFKQATYRIEAITTSGSVQRISLAETTISQNLRLSQIENLVKGQKIGINPSRIVTISAEPIGVADAKLDNLVEGLRKNQTHTASQSSRGITNRGTNLTNTHVDANLSRDVRKPLRTAKTWKPPSGSATKIKPLGRFVFRGFLRVVSVALPLLDIVEVVLLGYEIIEAITAHYREKAIDKALLKGLEKDIPKAIQSGISNHKAEIARYYIRVWESGKIENPFLYISPNINIGEVDADKSGYKFQAKLKVKNVEKDLVSTQFIKFERDDIHTTFSYYEINLRWSLVYPLFTPFDVYIFRLESFARIIVRNWFLSYRQRQPLSNDTVNTFYKIIRVFSIIIGTLKYEPFMGFRPSKVLGRTLYFDPKFADEQRSKYLKAMSKLIENHLLGLIAYLERKHPLETEGVTLTLFNEDEPLKDEVMKKGIAISLQTDLDNIRELMNRLANQDLSYKRFDTLAEERKHASSIIGMIPSIGIDRLTKEAEDSLLWEVEEFLPKSLKQQRDQESQFDFEVTPEQLQVRGW